MRLTRSRQRSSGHRAVAVLTLGPAVEQALVSRYFPELMALIADLPAGPFGRLPWHPATPAPPRMSRRATAALACAAAGPLTAGDHRCPSHHLRAYGTPAGPPDRRAGICRSDGGRRARLAHGADRRGHRRARCLTRQPAARGRNIPPCRRSPDWPACAPAGNAPYDLICTPQLRSAEAPAVVPNDGSACVITQALSTLRDRLRRSLSSAWPGPGSGLVRARRGKSAAGRGLGDGGSRGAAACGQARSGGRAAAQTGR